MTDRRVSVEEIKTHLLCPRQYEFEHVRSLSPSQSDGTVVRDRRKELLRDAVIRGLQLDGATPEERLSASSRYLEEEWSESAQAYQEQQASYDKRILQRAIKSYFEGIGKSHADEVVATDVSYTYEVDEFECEVTIDAVVEKEDRYLAVQFVPNLNSIVKLWTDDDVRDFVLGKEFYAKQIGSLIEGYLGVRVLTDEYGIKPHDVAYVGLLQDSRPGYADEDLHVETSIRYLGEKVRNQSDTIRSLIKDRGESILQGKTEPRDYQFEEILDRSCGYCSYRDACPEYIESSVAFTERRDLENELAESTGCGEHGADENTSEEINE